MFRYGVDSEYKLLKAVLLSKPQPKIDNASNPEEVLHLARIDYTALKEEFQKLVKLYNKLKIKVFFIDPQKIKGTDYRYIFNLIYARDHFFMTPRGAIVSRMFSHLRCDEVEYAVRALKVRGVRIRKVIQDGGTFEGADALWGNDRLVIVGVGKRTNQEGFRQLKTELSQDKIRCICVPAPQNVLHLLGALQFIDAETVLIRNGSVHPEVLRLLRRNKIKAILIPENAEIKQKQAMNFVTIGPRQIIMPALCPKTKKLYEKFKIKIAAEISTSQLVRCGGGIACATGILARG